MSGSESVQVTSGRPVRLDPRTATTNAVECPKCGSPPGVPCRGWFGRPRVPHEERWAVYEAAIGLEKPK